MGAELSKVEDAIFDTYKKVWPRAWCVSHSFRLFSINIALVRFLSPSFLASIGGVGYVGYAISHTKSIPSSPSVSLLHLIGVAGGFGMSFWMIAVHGNRE
jgi:hypothetical protein